MPTYEEMFQKAQQLIDEKKYQETIDLLSDGILEEYNKAELYSQKAIAYNRLNQMEKCFEYAEKAISINKSYFLAYNSRGNAWFVKEDFDKAIEDYSKAIELNPKFSTGFNNRGLARAEKKEYESAIADFTEAIELKFDNADAFCNRGAAWDFKKEYDKAIDDYSKAIELKPDDARAFCNRGVAWDSKKAYDKAIDDFTMAIKLDPDDELGFFNRGYTWNNKKEYDKAIIDYTKAVELNPNNPSSYLNMGVAFHCKKEYNKAIEEYEKALELDPTLSLAFKNLGVTYNAMGEYDKAIEHYQKAINLDKSYNYLQATIDELKAKTQKIDEIQVPLNTKIETSLYFLVKTIDGLDISDTDKKLMKDIGNTFLQAINEVRDGSFAENKEPVVHYTKLKVADILVSAKEEPKLRYYNVVYMNDPEEGEIIFDCLADDEIKKSFKSGMQDQENNIYLGSFLPAERGNLKNNHEDELVMWRTYGKDELKNEAAGCSIIINPEFFDKDKKYLHSDMFSSMEKAIEQKEFQSNQSLYSVLYFDKRDKQLLPTKNKDLNNATKDLKKAIKEFLDLKIKSEPADEKSKAIDKIVYRFLTEIRYLFKSADYAFENELRVIQYASPQNDEKNNLVKIDDNGNQWLPRRLYIESNKPVRPHICKIYLGPKVPNPQTWMYLEAAMKLKGFDKMELKKSERKFQ